MSLASLALRVYTGEMGRPPPPCLLLLTADLNRCVQWQGRLRASLQPAPRALFKPPPQAAAFSGSTPKPLFTVMKSEWDSMDRLDLPASSDSAFSFLYLLSLRPHSQPIASHLSKLALIHD